MKTNAFCIQITCLSLISALSILEPKLVHAQTAQASIPDGPGVVYRESDGTSLTESAPRQTIRYVDSTGEDVGGCSNPDNPCATINYAIDQAGTGDIISIASGAYTETISTTKSISLQGAGQNIPGGTIIQAHQSPGVSNEIIITAITNDFAISDLTIRNGRLGIYSDQGSLSLTNVTIRNNQTQPGGHLAGAWIYQSSVTMSGVTFENNSSSESVGALSISTIPSNTVSLNDVLFTGNQAGSFAGAMLISGGGEVSLEKVTFQQNTAGEIAGALYLFYATNISLNDVVFENNETAESGGGIYSRNSIATLTDIQFIGNKAASNGGAFFSLEDVSVSFTDVGFVGNEAPVGGAVSIAAGGNLNFVNSVFMDNEASTGGGIFLLNSSASIINSLFTGNKAVGGGGAINNNILGQMMIINSTIAGNETSGIGGGIINADDSNASLVNTILWGNTAETGGNEMFSVPSAIVTGTHSLYSDKPDDVSGGFSCANCVTDDPELTNPGAGNYTLGPGSPAINAGDPATDLSVFPGGPSNPLDLNGNARVYGSVIDIGAYEFFPLLDEIFSDRFE